MYEGQLSGIKFVRKYLYLHLYGELYHLFVTSVVCVQK